MKRFGLLFLVVAMAFGVVFGTAGCSKKDADPVGTWLMTGDTNCDSSTFTLTLHIFSNGTFIDEDGDSGNWEVDKDDITLNYTSGVGVVLTGQVDDNVIVGGRWSGISTGCWTAVKTSGTP